MDKHNHTPGPWKTANPNNPGLCLVADAEPGYFAVMRQCSHHHITHAEANLKLMAAAPTLLDACKIALRANTDGAASGYTIAEVVDILTAAIARATS